MKNNDARVNLTLEQIKAAYYINETLNAVVSQIQESSTLTESMGEEQLNELMGTMVKMGPKIFSQIPGVKVELSCI